MDFDVKNEFPIEYYEVLSGKNAENIFFLVFCCVCIFLVYFHSLG